MFARLRITQKIVMATLSIVLVSVIVTAVVGGVTSRTALEAAAFDRLTAVRELKAQQIEDYFRLLGDQAVLLASDPTTVDAVVALSGGARSIAGSDHLDSIDTDPLDDYYIETFADHSSQSGSDVDFDPEDYVPEEPLSAFLQLKYLVHGDEAGQGEAVTVLPDGADAAYDQAHADFDPFFTAFSDTFGFYDVFLIEETEGLILYTVENEIDFGTSLFHGPHADTNLAAAVDAALSADAGDVHFSDFQAYVPSFGDVAAFIASPVFVDGRRIGVVAFQIPVDRINSTMTSREAWADVGLGESGETYLVGPDRLLRSQSRFLIEDKESYLDLVAETGTPVSIVDRIRTQGTSIGLQQVDTEGTRAALSGESGEDIFLDYRGVSVLSSYRPVEIAGLDWVIMSEIDEAEAFAASITLRNRLLVFVGALLVLAAIAAYYVSRTITRPILSLEVSARQLGAGDLDEPVRVHSEDEVGELARSFETMRVALNESFAEVERQNAELETKVRDRTAELDEALAQQSRQNEQLEQQNVELVQIQADLLESQKELGQSRERIDRIVQSSPDGIVVIDRHGTIETFSASAEQLFGYYASEVLGKNVKVLMPDHVAENHDGYLERYYTGKPSTVVHNTRVVDAVRKDGSTFPMELKVEEVEIEGSESIFIGITRDIAVRLRLEAEIRAATTRAESANAAKSAFLANMSHELRTPMNAIIGYSEMLAEDAEDQGLDGMLDDLQRINSAGKHLLELINDVLDLSKIEAGKMDLLLESFSVAEMAEDVASTSRGLVEQSNNTLRLAIADDVGDVYADLTKVRQMLFNLVSNAAKFTTSGEIVLSSERFFVGAEDWLRMSVSDEGIGIPSDKLELIFQEFSQADESTTRNFGGTGLGLSLTRRFARMMGGEIRVESVAGRGSTFTFEIPTVVTPRQASSGSEVLAARDDESTDSADLDSQLDAESSKAIVLVIDDDANARELLRRALAQEGWGVVSAANGADGLRLAAEHKPSLITLDVLMPGMDGWAVLRRLKADPDLKDIPVIMVSMVGDKALGYDLGAIESLQKPVDRNRLRALLREHAGVPGRSVLVVEDDNATRRTIRRTLEGEAWTVVEAENGAVGLDRAAEQAFDLILLDLMMPVMDGFEFLQRLRSEDLPSRRSPVVVVTAKNLDDDDRALLEGTVHQVVSKSGDHLESLLVSMRQLLEPLPVRTLPEA